MLENKLNRASLGLTFFFVSLHLLEAKVFWIDFYPSNTRFPLNGFTQPNHEQEETPIVIKNVMKMLHERHQREKHHIDYDTGGNKCARIFGSIYGTKQQRLLCLKNLKRKKKHQHHQHKHQPSYINDLYAGKDPFLDLTRVDATKRQRTVYEPEFSTDYIDFSNIIHDQDTRRFSNQRTLYSSESDSSTAVDVKNYNVKYSKRPKRFQVVENHNNKKWASDEISSTDASSSPEVKRKRPAPKKVRHIQKYSSESSEESFDEYKYKPAAKLSSESELEIKKPSAKRKKVIKSNKKKEYYLQGQRLINPDDYDARKRMPHFLPKRFQWTEDEILNLGYSWFNGPQGKHPFHPLRP